jgi:hypothetical protein
MIAIIRRYSLYLDKSEFNLTLREIESHSDPDGTVPRERRYSTPDRCCSLRLANANVSELRSFDYSRNTGNNDAESRRIALSSVSVGITELIINYE